MTKSTLTILSVLWALFAASCSKDPSPDNTANTEISQKVVVNLSLGGDNSKTRAVLDSKPAVESKVDDVWLVIVANHADTPASLSSEVLVMKELDQTSGSTYSTTISGAIVSKIDSKSRAYIVANINDNTADKNALKNVKTLQDLQSLKFKAPMSDKAVLTAISFVFMSEMCIVDMQGGTIVIKESNSTATPGSIKIKRLSCKLEVKRGIASALASVTITGGVQTTGLFGAGASSDALIISDLDQNIGGVGAYKGYYYLYPTDKIEVSMKEVGGSFTANPVEFTNLNSNNIYMINAGGSASYAGSSEAGVTSNGLTFETSNSNAQTISFIIPVKGGGISVKDESKSWISVEKAVVLSNRSVITSKEDEIVNVILTENLSSAPRSGVVMFNEYGKILEVIITQKGVQGAQEETITLTAPGQLAAKLSATSAQNLIINGEFFNSADTIALKNYITEKQLFALTLTDVETLQDNTFNGCKTLTSLTLPKLKSIGNATFKGCTNLKIVSSLDALLAKATSIPKEAFSGCSSLALNGNFPEVTNTGEFAFNGCKELATVNLPKVTNIGHYTFNGCTTLTKVTLPTQLPGYPRLSQFTLGTGAFMGCSSLHDINFPENMFPLSLFSGTFQGCTSLEKIGSAKITRLGTASFLGCKLLKSIEFPELMGIEKNALAACGFTSVSLPKVTTIDGYGFSSNSKLTSVIAPSVTRISENAFLFCPQLSALVIKGNPSYPPSIDAKAFGDGVIPSMYRVPSLFLCGDTVFGPVNYDSAESLAAAWKDWGGHPWPKLHSNYNGTGALDDPASYSMHWTR